MSVILNATNASLQVILAGAKNTNDATGNVSWKDVGPANSPGFPAEDAAVFTTNGVTAVELVPAQGQAPQIKRRLVGMTLFNADLAAITLSIRVLIGGTSTVIFKCTLQTLETLNYEEGYGFTTIDASGAIKTQAVATSSATSTADSKAVSVSVVVSTVASTQTLISVQQSGASVQSFTSTTFSTVSSTASNALLVSSLQSAASVQSFTSTIFSTISSTASNALLVSSLQSAASVQSFTSTAFSTNSSAVSRLKASFTW